VECGPFLEPSAPSIFTANASGVGQAAIVNHDGTINSASNPALRGTAIQVYATGGGQTSPPSSTGIAAAGQANLALPVSVAVGGVNAQVLYAGAAPGEVEGVVQVNVMVPQSVAPGVALPVLVTIGSVTSQTGVTVAIQ
jgi:trimeric autotransporter adhesin